MTAQQLMDVIALGDKYGSALKEMLKWLDIKNLTEVTDEQVEAFLQHKNNDKQT